MSAEFSPTPAVNTMPSMPFMAQPRPIMPSATRQAKYFSASWADGASLASSSRMSLLMPDRPFMPQS
ncbi:hypothetical protein G6F32_017387 [Rhizopus arrhizus]|nr:hypothetical protein G6F32_017387 [Rhizopus arrhizus]